MPPTVADIRPKTIENAGRQFLELHGSAMVLNTYLKLALLVVGLVALGLVGLNYQTLSQLHHVKPMVIRIDEVGRAQAVSYDVTSRYQPQANELRYFLTQFIVKHFSRVRASLKRDFPDSLFFLSPGLADRTMNHLGQSQVLENFLQDTTTKEVEVEVRNVTLTELTTPPFRAAVDFIQRTYTPGSRFESASQTYVAQLSFTLLDTVPANFVPVNPLGFQISYFRVDQAFSEAAAGQRQDQK